MLQKKIADRIRQIRKSKELTLAQLGDKLGLSKAFVTPPHLTEGKMWGKKKVNVSLSSLTRR